MLEIIDNILGFIFIIGIISFTIFFIIALGYQLYEMPENNLLRNLSGNIYFRVVAICSLVSFILIFSLSFYIHFFSRIEIKDRMNNLTNKTFVLIINDSIKTNDSLIVALKNIQKPSEARTTGNLKIDVRIKGENQTIEVILLRDFNKKTKYWVFYNKYKSTSDNCVGEINTEFLNEY